MNIDITTDAIVAALGAFISGVVSVPVIRTQVNRVSMPPADFVAMTLLRAEALEVSTNSYNATSKLVQRSTQYEIQVDCYGASGGDNAQMLATLLRDDYSFQAMLGTGVEPLYATEASQMPLITGEEQYLQRWTFRAVLQASPTVTVPQDFATSLTPTLVDVEVRYPA